MAVLIPFVVAIMFVLLFGSFAGAKNTEQSKDPEGGDGWERLGCLSVFAMLALGVFFFLVGGAAGLAR